MVGITSLEGYVPGFRLDKKILRRKGEGAICNFNEDSTTLAVAAAVNDCLKGLDRTSVDGLFLGTTTSFCKEVFNVSRYTSLRNIA